MRDLSIPGRHLAETVLSELQLRANVREWFRKHIASGVVEVLVKSDSIRSNGGDWAGIRSALLERLPSPLSPMEALIADFRLSDTEMRFARLFVKSYGNTSATAKALDVSVSLVTTALSELRYLLQGRE